jgi:hypothetical protein
MNSYASSEVGQSSLTSSGGSVGTSTWNTITLSTSATLANSRASRHSTTGSGAVIPWAQPGHPSYKINFAKVVAARWTIGNSNTSPRVPLEGTGWVGCFIAQTNAIATLVNGEVANIGFGWKLDAAGDITVSTRNASGLTTSVFASGFGNRTVSNDVTANEVYQFSDGAGTLYTYVDGVLKSTITAGPTTMSNVANSPFAVWGIHLDNGTSTPTGQTAFTFSYPALYFGL